MIIIITIRMMIIIVVVMVMIIIMTIMTIIAMIIMIMTLMINISDTLSPSCTEQMVSPKRNYNQITDRFLS